MNKLAIIAAASLALSGCGCEHSIGDRVIDATTRKAGYIVGIDAYAGWTSNCRVAVRFDDGTYSGPKGDEFVYGWRFANVGQ